MRKFTEAIGDATEYWLEKDQDFSVFGLGASYPNGLDGTHRDLASRFGQRVADVPISESSVTGMALGRALSGRRTMIHHGRAEFALFAADQIFTQAAKWRYQFGGNVDVPLVLRIAMGRQWGNGPQHTASYLQFFSSVPGLKVFIPSSPNQAELLLKLAIDLVDPVVFLEPRWLYQISQLRGSSALHDSANPAIQGSKELAVVTYGEGVLDAAILESQLDGTKITVFDFWDLTPGNATTLVANLRSFNKILLFDPYCTTAGPLAELALQLADEGGAPRIHVMRPPNTPVPTATSVTPHYYLNSQKLKSKVSELLGLDSPQGPDLTFEELHLPPKVKLGEKWEVLES